MKFEKKYLNLILSLIFKIFLNIFVVFYVAKKVTVSDFGSFSIAFILSALAILFLDYGFNLRSLVLSANNEDQVGNELWQMVYSKVVLTLVLLLGGAFFYFFGPYDDITLKLILILGLSAIPNSFGNYFVNSFKINDNYKIEAIAYTIQFFTLLIYLFVTEIYLEADTVTYALGILIARICYFIYGHIIFVSEFPRKIQFNLYESLRSIKITASFAIHMILSAMIIHIDTFVLSIISTLEQVGFYQAGMRIIMASMLIAVIISDAFIPEISRLANQKKQAFEKLSNLFDFVVLFAILTIATVFYYKRTLITLLFSKEYLVLENSIFIILAIIALRYFGIVPGIILTSFGKQKIRAVAVVASIIVSVTLNLILIPVYGIEGAFFASLMAHIVLNILYLYFSSKILIFYKDFSFLLILSLGAVCVLLQKFLFEDSIIFLICTIAINLIFILMYFHFQKMKVQNRSRF